MLNFRTLKFINAGALTFTMATTLIFLNQAWQCTQMTHFKAHALKTWDASLKQILTPHNPEALDGALQGTFLQVSGWGFGMMALGYLLWAAYQHPSVQQRLQTTLAKWRNQHPPVLQDEEKTQLIQQHKVLSRLIALPLSFSLFLWCSFWLMAHLVEIVTYIDMAKAYFHDTQSKIGMQVAYLQGMMVLGEILLFFVAVLGGSRVLKLAVPWYGTYLQQRPTRSL
ncbi:hypothetical protein [Deinococcus roseus]|uniref:DUF975 family protein n=1 Tax=Deinococcus roseus TaxID=392414 RepID=A0ABQ2D386_9DEIO|nr:hypothetical protein [Deinococcus roseus]GGJ44415.1 hypothetical protein GCM10008938_33270 [Deinococcus roseus]